MCFAYQFGIAQITNKSNNVGMVKGFVYDSLHNYNVRLASVAIYDQKDSLLNYTLTNQFGEFTLNKLIVSGQLQLIVNMDGYKRTVVKLIIPGSLKYYDCKVINLSPINKEKVTTLDDVLIKATAPVKMNGDTLEFNADAFKLDTNAVVEDLVRRLPGFVIWGDGLITVNGRKVERVLVGGKPFFGDNAKTALQNIPKSNVEKIQVYSLLNDKKNTSDSLTEVNIKLKAGKNRGLFGKISIGSGTDKRYVFDAMLNVFNASTQFGIVGASNNTNAIAKDINTLIQFNSFKGIGVGVDYQSDFNLQGITKFKALGAKFQHDFITDPSYYKNDRVQADYLFRVSDNSLSRNTITQTTINEFDRILQSANYKTDNQTESHNFNAKYNKRNPNFEYYVLPTLAINKGSFSDISNLEQRNEQNILSISNRANENEFYERNTNIDMGLKMSGKTNKIWAGMDLNYLFNNKNTENKEHTLYELNQFSVSRNGYFIDRVDNGNTNESDHKISIRSNEINTILLPHARLGGINASLVNILSFKTIEDRSNVMDLDTVTNRYLINNYLTNRIKNNSLTFIPSLELTKSFNRVLLDRFQKSFDITLKLKQQFFNQKNYSEREFQNFIRQYSNFTPGLSLSYLDNRFNNSSKRFSIEYTTKVDYPMLDQIAPLADSSALYSIKIGNSEIKDQLTRQLSFSFGYEAQKRNKDNIIILANINAGIVENKIAESIIFDASGRQTLSFVNVDGYRFLNGNSSLRRPVKLSGNQNLQFEWSTNFQISRSPNYTNSIFNISKNSYWSQNLNIYYSYKNSLILNARLEYSDYKSTQSNNGFEFRNEMLKSSFNSSYNFNKSFTITNNVEYRNNQNNISNQPNFTIWNVNVSKRFLKGNNLELKASALDLLRQNKGVIAYGNNSSFTSGSVNVLNNYYLITMSYFPRKF